jgi:transposase
VTLLSSMTQEGMGPSLAVEGSTTKVVFEAYLQRLLAPSLRPGQVVVMDNLSSHKGPRVRELIEGRSCELMYLPPYSPDLNPIEEAFSKIKGLLRKAEARSRDALVEAMGRAISTVTPRDAEGFFGTVATVYQLNNYDKRSRGGDRRCGRWPDARLGRICGAWSRLGGLRCGRRRVRPATRRGRTKCSSSFGGRLTSERAFTRTSRTLYLHSAR